MMSSWEYNISNKLKEIREVNSQDSPDLNKIPFWSLQFHIDDHELRSALKDIALRIEGSGASLEHWPIVFVLLFIVRTRLKNVAANYMWPEVAKELNKASGRDLFPDQCGIFFRKILLKKYPEELHRGQNSFPYVALLLSQTGTGKERRYIVTKYFSNLAESIRNTRNYPLSSQLVYDCYDQLVRGNADIKALETVLVHSGKLLVKLISALRNSVNPIELALWDWGKLVSFWKHETGGNLEIVLPEAAEIFPKIIKQLPDVMTRAQLASFLTNKIYNVSGPGIAPKRPIEEYEIPLTTVQFQRGDTSRYITIADNSGYTADTISMLPEQEWSHSRGYLIYRDSSPFTVSMGPGNLVPAVAYIKRNHVEPNGYFWSGKPDGNSQRIVENQLSAPETVSISPNVIWRLKQSRIIFQILSVDLRHAPSYTTCNLTVNHEEIWQGKLQGDSDTVQISKHEESLTSVFDEITVALYHNKKKCCDADIHFPFRRKPFLLTDLKNSGFRERDWLEEEKEIETFFLVTGNNDKVHIDSPFKYKKIAESKNVFPGGIYDIYQLSPCEGKVADLVIFINDHLWFCGKDIRPHFIRPVTQKVNFQSVSISGSGSIYPLIDDLKIKIPHFLSQENDIVSAWILRLCSETLSTDLDLKQVTKFESTDTVGDRCINVPLETLLRFQDKNNGLLYLHLYDKTGLSVDSLTIFPLTGEFEIKPCQVKQYSEISFLNREEINTFSTTSDKPVNIQKDNSIHLYKAQDSSSLEIRWTPLLKDILLIADDQVVDESKDFNFSSEQTVELYAESLGGKYKVESNEKSILLETNDRKPLLAILNLLQADSSDQPCRIQATAENISRQWFVNLLPKMHHFESKWREESGLILEVNFSCFCLKISVITVRCKINNVSFSEATADCVDYEFNRGDFKGKATLHIPESYSGADLVIQISSAGHQLFKKQLRSPGATSQNDPAGIKQRIVSLVTCESERTLKPELLEYELLSLVGKYFSLAGHYPFPLQRLADSVNRLAQKRNDNFSLLCDGLLLFGKLEHEQPAYPGDINIRKDPAGILLNTLKLALEIRRMERGLARPEFFNNIIDYSKSAQTVYQGTIFFTWLSFIGQYSKLILRRMGNGISLVDTDMRVPEELNDIFIFNYDEFKSGN